MDTIENNLSLTDEGKKARAEYQREWRRKNPDKVKASFKRYWEKKANNILLGEKT